MNEICAALHPLDAVRAAPDHHRVALDDVRVRVLETRIEPGEIVNLHVHEWPAATYVLSWSHLVRRDAQGAVILDTREGGTLLEVGQAAWLEPMDLHTVENVGDQAIHVITFELKPSPLP